MTLMSHFDAVIIPTCDIIQYERMVSNLIKGLLGIYFCILTMEDSGDLSSGDCVQ